MCGVYDNSLLIQYLIQPEQYLSNPFSNKSEELVDARFKNVECASIAHLFCDTYSAEEFT